MIIADLMSVVTACVPPDTPLIDVVEQMRTQRTSCVLITEGNTPLGIITERDLVAVLADTLAQGKMPQLLVSQVMTPEPVSMLQSTSLSDALVLTRSRKLRHLLVTDTEGCLVGLVTQTDMVEAYMRLIQQHTELEIKNKELYLLSNEDALMGIGNRRAMEVELDFYQASAKRYSKYYAVALLDVDFFKKYNDSYGHQMGDEALQALAAAIQSSMRDTDKVYRYGGEEILLLMPETNSKDAEIAVERIRLAVEGMQRPHNDSPFNVLTVSVGVATAVADESWQHLVERADKVLYQAKDSGRNQVLVASGE